MQGIVESIIMDSLPLRDMNPTVQRVPSNVMGTHKPKVHGRSYCDSTACYRTRKRSVRIMESQQIDRAYVKEAAKKERNALEHAVAVYSGRGVRRLIECRALDDLVGVAVVHFDGYIVWHSYSPMSGSFTDSKVVPHRSDWLKESDVRHLAGYATTDKVVMRTLR